jgi:predicted dinucleotide-binding enzyme
MDAGRACGQGVQLGERTGHGHPATLFYCGDDTAAKRVVHQLAADIGFDPVDAGPLLNARYLEPLAMLYIHLAIRSGWGSNTAFRVLKREAK